MKETMRNSLIGLFVIGSVLVLGALMVMFGEGPGWLRSSEWELNITGPREIRGISDGSPVYLNGVEIGRVLRLEFKNQQHPGIGVNIIAGIRLEYSVPRGAVAKIYGATLGLGTGQVHIVAPDVTDRETVPTDGTGAIIGEMASVIGEIITEDMISSVHRMVDNIGTVAREATPVMENVADLIAPRTVAQVDRGSAAANVATVFERIDDLVANLNKVLGDKNVQDDVRGVARDLKVAAEGIKEMIVLWQDESKRISNNVNEGIDTLEGRFVVAIDRLIVVAENLDRSTKDLAVILDGVSKGEGTAGLLVRDDRLYEAMVLSLERFADAMASINRITGKIERDGYITVGQVTPVGTFTKEFPIPLGQAHADDKRRSTRSTP